MSTSDVVQPPAPEPAGGPARRPARAGVKKAPAAKKTAPKKPTRAGTPPAQRRHTSPRLAVPDDGLVTVYRAVKAQTVSGVRYHKGDIVPEAGSWLRLDSWLNARWIVADRITPEQRDRELGIVPAEPQTPAEPPADPDAPPADPNAPPADPGAQPPADPPAPPQE